MDKSNNFGAPGHILGVLTMNPRRVLSRLVRPLPQWSAVALTDPQTQMQIQLSLGSVTQDVTRNLVVASLRPLTLAMGLDTALQGSVAGLAGADLRFFDRDLPSRQLGALRLLAPRVSRTGGAQLGLFEIAHGQHRCLPWPRRPWNRWMQNRVMRKNRDPYNFSMPPAAAEQLMIFYICPRPVVLVSVDDGSHSNIFPMDLIGPIEPGWFTLALRTTNVSVEVMKTVRRVALSSIAASDRAVAYQLGVHHSKPTIDWGALPFAIERSAQFSLPVPSSALRIRELEIWDFESIGSHTFFVTRVVSDRTVKDGAQLFHTSGLHQDFRAHH
jgi:flavin reductase (DIM6/NTAB) family NADH-FMN oxidoreductase RutF